MRYLSVLGFFLLVLTFVPTSSFAAATMDDYWQGKAQWKLVNKWTVGNTGWDYGYGAGAHINIVGNNWYLFGRKPWTKQNQTCVDSAGTQVRKSTDKGATWSAPVDIITPAPGTPWECAGTDGDAYYNASENKWHYLFQCLAPGGAWNGCEVERSGDPMGPFQQTHANPVIKGVNKDLWRDICTDGSKDCYNISGGNNVFDAGTFNIFDYIGGYYYVGFHGFDGGAQGEHGYRGVAKTPDFINWTAGGQGVPVDAVLDKYDQANFRESWQGEPKGFAAGSILKEGSYYYLVSESFDLSLLCADGQNWDWGMFRSSSLSSTKWESLPAGNPFLYSSKKPERNGKSIGCSPAYTRIFKEPSSQRIYMQTTRLSMNQDYDGIYLYELVSSNNLLQNGNLWKCNSENWQRISPGANTTNIISYRYPNESSDGNCYLAFNCGGGSCDPGQSIYQDAEVGNVPYRKIAYGGKFATEDGEGSLLLDILEFDSSGNLINETKTNINVSQSYQLTQNQIALKDATAKVRFQVYMNTNNGFKADEMFLEPIAQFYSPTPEPSIAPPLPKKESCSVSAPSTASSGQPFNINFTALADDVNQKAENLWIERTDGQKINPPPNGTLVTSAGINYYKLTTCTSSTQLCSGSATVSLPPGSYITHCDSNGKNKCSGNPFCDYNGGPVDCTSTGWRDCGPDDSQAITVSDGVATPEVVSVIFNGGQDVESAKSLDLTGANPTSVVLSNKTGDSYIASADVTVSTRGLETTRHLTIKFKLSPVPSPTPTTSFEIGLEAGEQNDTSRVDLVSQSGAKWVRLNFIGENWAPGSSEVNTYNGIINAYLNKNIKIIGLIGAQSVAGGYNRSDPAGFTSKFTNAAKAVVDRFGDRVKVYELFNEPNDWAGGNTAQVSERYFAEFLASIYRKIKIEGVRGDIFLNSGPLFSHDQNNGASYLQETYTQGKALNGDLDWDTIKNETGSYPLDGIGYHIYVSQGMGDQGQVQSKLLGNLDAIKEVINNNDPAKGIWVTEMGWGTGPNRVTEDVQAANLAKAYGILAVRPGVKLGMWFTLMDFDGDEWGLIRQDGTKKKAWYKFLEMTNANNATPTPAPTLTPAPSATVSPSSVPSPSVGASPSPAVSPSPTPSASLVPADTPAPTSPPETGEGEMGEPPIEALPIPNPELRVILVGSQPVDPSGQSLLALRLLGQTARGSSVLVPVSVAYTQGESRNMSIQFNYIPPGQGEITSIRRTDAQRGVSNTEAVITPRSPDLRYDLNNDKIINSIDVTMFFNSWRSKVKGGGSITKEDFNADGIINSVDYAVLKGKMGRRIQ